MRNFSGHGYLINNKETEDCNMFHYKISKKFLKCKHVGKDVEKQELSYATGGNLHWFNPCEGN
jgi:hypothetical protein